jgi:hypothetical protein
MVVACGLPKDTLDLPTKCDQGPKTVWRYDHTDYWTTSEPVYGVRAYIDFGTGELKTDYGITGYETVEHSRDVWSCQHRR